MEITETRGDRQTGIRVAVVVAVALALVGLFGAVGSVAAEEPGENEVLNDDTGESFDGDSAIQDAIDDADTDETLLVGEGTYEEDVTVDVDRLTIEDSGGATIEPEETAFEVTADDVTIDGVTISGGSGDGITADSLSGTLTVTDTTIENVDGEGISTADVENVVATENILENIGGGFNQDGINVWQGEKAEIRDNDIDDTANSGILVEDLDEADVEDNDLRSIPGHGILLIDTQDATITGNEMSESSSSEPAIELSNHGSATITDNHIEEEWEGGILFISAGEDVPEITDGPVTIEDNTIEDSASIGIDISEVNDDIDIRENELTAISAQGINIQSAETGSEVAVTDNELEDVDGSGIQIGSVFDSIDIVDNELDDAGGRSIEVFFVENDLVIAENTLRNADTGIFVDDAAATISENVIENNADTGILLDENFDADGSEATQNDIVDNDDGVVNEADDTFDATENWWGAENGPSGGVDDPDTGETADGDGDSVSEDVAFDPWLEASFDASGESELTTLDIAGQGDDATISRR